MDLMQELMGEAWKVRINDSNGPSSPWIYMFCFQSHAEAWDAGERIMSTDLCTFIHVPQWASL